MASKSITHLQRYGVVSFFGNLASYTTWINTYEAVDQFPTSKTKNKVLTFTATTHDLKVKLLGNYDGSTTCNIEVIPEFNVLVGSPVTKTLTNVHVTMEVQVAPLVGGQHGTLDTNIFCTSG